jgi:hypothetical protein
MSPELHQLLLDLDTALADWVKQYAPEHCGENHVRESAARVWDRGGTLAYIADLRGRIKEATSAPKD